MKKGFRKTLLILLTLLMGLTIGLFFVGCNSCQKACGGEKVDRRLLDINTEKGISYVLPLGESNVFCSMINFNAETDIVYVDSSDPSVATVEFNESQATVVVTTYKEGFFEILVEGESENKYFGDQIKELLFEEVEVKKLVFNAPRELVLKNGSETMLEYESEGYELDEISFEDQTKYGAEKNEPDFVPLFTVENGIIKANRVGEGTLRFVAKLADSPLRAKTIVCTVKITDEDDKLAINKTSAALQINETTQLSILDYAGVVTWSSNNPEIATVDTDGKVTAIAVGTATITGTVEDGRKFTCTVDVSAKLVSISLYNVDGEPLPGFVELEEGQELIIQAVVDNSSEVVTWASDNENINLVIDGNMVTVTAVSEGIANLTATIGEVSVSVGIDVAAEELPVDPPSLTVNKTELTIDIHGGYQLIAVAENTNEVITYKSADTSIATVDANGLIRGATKTGTTTITVTCGALSQTVTVTVEDKGVAPVCTMNLDEVVLGMGDSIDLIATVTYEGIKVLELDNADWMINDGSNESIVNIQEKSDTVATITGASIGETIVKYQYTVNGIPDLELVKVIVMSDSITTELSGTDLKGDDTNGYTLALSTVGETYPKSSTVVMTVKDGDTAVANPVITWETSNALIATVENGVITAKGAGSAIITAKYQGFTKNITVTVTTGEMIISGTVLLERYNPVPMKISSEIEGEVTSVTLNNVEIMQGTFNSEERTVVLNAKAATTLADLGKEVSIKYVTNVASYTQKAIVYSKIIRTASDLDQFAVYAANETYDTSTGSNQLMKWTGHFIMANDISYNGGDAKAYESFADYQDFKDTKDASGNSLESSWYRADLYGFTGIFDGQGYNIDGMRLAQRAGQTSVGFISVLHTDGLIKNMSFTNFNMPGWGAGLSNVVAGTIQDIYMHISWIGAGDPINFKQAPSAPIAAGIMWPAGRVRRVFIENERADSSAFAFGQTELNQGNWDDCYYVGPLTKSLLPRVGDGTYLGDPSQGNDSVAMYSDMSAFRTLSTNLNFGNWATTNPEMWAVDSYSKSPVPAKMDFINDTGNPVAISWNTTETCVAEFGAEISETASLYNMTYKFNATPSGTKNVTFNGDMVNRFGSNLIIMIDDGSGDLKYSRAILGNLVIKTKADLNKMGTVAKAGSSKPWQWDGTFYLAKDIEYNGNYASFITYGKLYEVWQANKSSWPSGYSEWDSRAAGFFGTFDGLGHNINGLKINETAGGFVGLLSGGDFINNDDSKTWKQGVIKNVSFTNARIDAESGFLACDMAGIVQNVYIHASYQGAGTPQNPTGFISAKNSYGAARVRHTVVLVDEVAATDDSNYMYTTGLGHFWDHITPASDPTLYGVAVVGNTNAGTKTGGYAEVGYRANCGTQSDGWSGCTHDSDAANCPNAWNDGQWFAKNTQIAAWIQERMTVGFIKFDTNGNPTTYCLEKLGWDTTSKAFLVG